MSAASQTRTRCIDEITIANSDLAQMAALARWAARGALFGDSFDKTDPADGLFSALDWMAEQMDARCSAIDEALSHL